MITLRSLITPVIIAAGLSFMSGQAFAEAKADSVLVPKPTSKVDRHVYIDSSSVKMKLSDHTLSWQISILNADSGVVTNNIEINLIDKDGFVVNTLFSFCAESKPFSLTLFRGANRFDSDVREIKTLTVKTKSVGKNFCHGYGVNQGELQIVGEDLAEWVKTATLSEYLTLTTSN
jgi:hypothetical protein